MKQFTVKVRDPKGITKSTDFDELELAIDYCDANYQTNEYVCNLYDNFKEVNGTVCGKANVIHLYTRNFHADRTNIATQLTNADHKYMLIEAYNIKENA